MKPIPTEWIWQYTKKLFEMAKLLGLETEMGQACILRAEHIIDMVAAWKEKDKD